MNEDTIVALATPPGIGAISVIRISGAESIIAADKIFRGKISLESADGNTIHYGNIVNEKNEQIDDVLISVFRNPHSFTGEDSIEISTHGSSLITQRVIEQLLHKGVRLAEPGEFTKRAFLNGKMDLAQAEAVADIINSRTNASLRGARNQLDGAISAKVSELREMLVNASSFIELELDFAEEDVEFIKTDELIKRIDLIVSEIDQLLSTYGFGRVLRDGVNVALVGLPNVGKSSLLNFILKESRAIVSEIPGTTRDIIREDVSINGVLYKLFDTAGIRLSDDVIEKEGVLRSREAIKNADVVLMISDVEQGFSEELFLEIQSLVKENKIIRILNKIDLNNSSDIVSDVKVSAITGEGMESFFNLLETTALGSNNYSEKTVVISNVRHYDCLKKARENLITAQKSAIEKMSGEFLSIDLRNAELSLAEIIGEVTSDDILNNIFTKFCIGK